jgi:acyl dehydratase
MNEAANEFSTVKTTFSGIPAIVGKHFRGAWFTVDTDRLPMFLHAAYTDENPNPLYEGYPDHLIEGFHVLALLDHLVNNVVYVTDPDWFGWNYGLDRVRFVSPITADTPIRLTGVVSDVQPRGDDYLVTLDCVVNVKGREKPGAAAVWKVLWSRAPAAPESEGGALA